MNQITITVDKHVGIIFKYPFGVCTLSHDVEFRDVPCSPENPASQRCLLSVNHAKKGRTRHV